MPPQREIYEKLGAFYLGKAWDPETRKTTDDLLLYDSKDLLTHAVCVGMTGSGKTGLCISLLEEAAIDGIPAIIVDPKGDLGNLLLTFPDLAPEDFRPWIDEGAAERKGLSPDEYAASQAETWRKGLEAWGEDGERIAKLRQAAEFAIYTPGSDAGLPVSILASFGAPPAAVIADGDFLQERIGSTVSGLLGLLGIDADPLRSREHILLSNILTQAWQQGQSHDLGTLIGAIQNPPLTKIGVFDLESFFPSKDRFELAMALNNLLAAPGFQSWFSGEPLDIGSLLYTAEGKPRHAIFSIGHLSERERMFFVSLLLNQTLAWMRQRPGSSSLQALLYMDEVFGYMPPVANPPSKQAMLTLLKQARAFGLGVVLATQNPVDLDYKGLSNTGTWFLGRLQTERDKERVIEGLRGAADSGFDRQRIETLLSSLDQRVFLLYNVHEDGPVLFQTRWAMSYLRGPMTRLEIQRLMAERKAETTATPEPAATAAPAIHPAVAAAARPGATPAPTAPRPAVESGVSQVFVPATQDGEILYEPYLLGTATVHYVDSRRGIEHSEPLTLLLPLESAVLRVDWTLADEAELAEDALERAPAAGSSFGELAPEAHKASSYTGWKRQLGGMLYRERRCDLWHSPTLDMVSRPGEEEGPFRVRLAESMREARDAKVEELRRKYATRVERVEERIRKAQQKLEVEQDQAKSQKAQTWISVGMAAASVLFGRKTLSQANLGKASSAARGFSRSSKEAQDVERAQEDIKTLEQQKQELEREIEDAIADLEDRFDARGEALETVQLKPRKSDVTVHLVALAWVPYATDGSPLHPAWHPAPGRKGSAS